MRISCVAQAREIGTEAPDLIVFPEYADPAEIGAASLRYPHSIIVAAVQEGCRSRGKLIHDGKNQIDYPKIGCDGRTVGTGINPRMPIYELPHICVGVVICMDVQARLWSEIIDRMKASTSTRRFLCIPADMGLGSGWNLTDPVDFRLEGIHLILCNHPTNKEARYKSFMTDAGRTVVRQQTNREPLHLDLT